MSRKRMGAWVQCVVCGRLRREGRGTERPGYPFRVVYALRGENPGPHPAGSPVCWHHTLERADTPMGGAGSD